MPILSSLGALGRNTALLRTGGAAALALETTRDPNPSRVCPFSSAPECVLASPRRQRRDRPHPPASSSAWRTPPSSWPLCWLPCCTPRASPMVNSDCTWCCTPVTYAHAGHEAKQCFQHTMKPRSKLPCTSGAHGEDCWQTRVGRHCPRWKQSDVARIARDGAHERGGSLFYAAGSASASRGSRPPRCR